ncbi:MAG TPA: MscL family protein [Gemmatimonadaceae bacterium]|nr:MscL family protein [Gemmatimonadaceae bacterium]
MWRDFKAFLIKDNVLALAIAVVIGAAIGKVVTALVDDFIMPIVGAAVPGGDWRAATFGVGRVQFLVGHFLGTLLDFLIIGFVVWRLSRVFIRPSPTAPTKPCPFCRAAIDAAATRCAHCTSQLAV